MSDKEKEKKEKPDKMPSTTWSAVRGNTVLASNGDQIIQVRFTDDADGHTIGVETYRALANGSKVINERTGLTVAAPVPAALASAGSDYATAITNVINSGVSGGTVRP